VHDENFILLLLAVIIISALLSCLSRISVHHTDCISDLTVPNCAVLTVPRLPSHRSFSPTARLAKKKNESSFTTTRSVEQARDLQLLILHLVDASSFLPLQQEESAKESRVRPALCSCCHCNPCSHTQTISPTHAPIYTDRAQSASPFVHVCVLLFFARPSQVTTLGYSTALNDSTTERSRFTSCPSARTP
jgi:hypothetical protein